MVKIQRSDRCKDCSHCRVWSSDRTKATCDLKKKEGFHPDRPVPSDCIGEVTRRY